MLTWLSWGGICGATKGNASETRRGNNKHQQASEVLSSNMGVTVGKPRWCSMPRSEFHGYGPYSFWDFFKQHPALQGWLDMDQNQGIIFSASPTCGRFPQPMSFSGPQKIKSHEESLCAGKLLSMEPLKSLPAFFKSEDLEVRCFLPTTGSEPLPRSAEKLGNDHRKE